MWKPGDRLTHRLNPGLGPGRVVAVHGRSVEVEFPDAAQTLRVAADAGALVPLTLAPGVRARLEGTGETVTIAALDGDFCLLADGRRVPAGDLWPLPADLPLVERLARGEVDAREDFVNRLDGLRLLALRQAGGLGSFLGGRIRLFPHQLYAAERATAADPVRWLLADEVGLGKTVEACLILNRLLHTGRAERTLVVAPGTLVIQWLGELWRKYHQAFALLDDKRLADVARDHGADWNPFDVHRRAVVSLETLTARPRLTAQAVEAGVDLLVVDEAHHLKRLPGHPGNAEYRAVAPIAALGRNVLLLTATPLEDDAQGFFRLLQILRPEELPESESFADRLARRQPLPPCTSAARRADIGGLPPRVPVPIDVEDPGWQALSDLGAPAPADPRVRWLVDQARAWRQAGEKTLVFVARRPALDGLKAALELQALQRVGIFHEDLSPERRDIEVAQFRLAEGPAILISTEAGGEGRNFEFCRRLVLFDLPWNPVVVEQRIGRLDRIGRTRPTEIVYFRPSAGLGRAIAGLYESIGIFNEPLGGLERELRHVARAIARAAADAGEGEVDPAVFGPVLAEAREARTRVQEAAYHELHRAPYRPEMAAGILDRVPPDLDRLTADVVQWAAARFGFEIERQSGRDAWQIEFGPEALVDHLPGVPPGSRYLGTFDREEAVEDESRDFFANGHPLVEGILAELEDGPRGRVALLQVAGDEDAFGLLAIYKTGPQWQAVAVDREGNPRPDLAAVLTVPGSSFELVEAKKWTAQAGWAKTIRKMAEALPKGDEPQAVAAFRVRRRK